MIENDVISDIHRVDDRGFTPLTLALTYKHTEIVEFFISYFEIENVDIKLIPAMIEQAEANGRR